MLDGASRAEAAKVGVMDRQTLRDWVIRFNEQGPDGLINIPAPGAPAKLNKGHRAFLARIVDEGPIPAIHGVVRWRGCDLIMRLHEEFGISVSDDTVYRALKDLGFSHVSARPRAYKQDGEANVMSITARTNRQDYSCDHTSERGWSPPQKQESDMNEFTNEVRELDIDQLDSVSGGDLALDIAIKAYEDLGKRVVAAVHQPVTQPTSPMHF